MRNNILALLAFVIQQTMQTVPDSCYKGTLCNSLFLDSWALLSEKDTRAAGLSWVHGAVIRKYVKVKYIKVKTADKWEHRMILLLNEWYLCKPRPEAESSKRQGTWSPTLWVSWVHYVTNLRGWLCCLVDSLLPVDFLGRTVLDFPWVRPGRTRGRRQRKQPGAGPNGPEADKAVCSSRWPELIHLPDSRCSSQLREPFLPAKHYCRREPLPRCALRAHGGNRSDETKPARDIYVFLSCRSHHARAQASVSTAIHAAHPVREWAARPHPPQASKFPRPRARCLFHFCGPGL